VNVVARSSIQSFYARMPLPIQSAVVAAVGWRRHRLRFGGAFKRALRSLKESDLRDADRVAEDQDARLREMVRWAATTVPYYRDLFRKEGIDPASIHGREDLSRIPPLDKETVRARALDLRSEAIPDRDTFPAHSSGTTGTALALWHTREALAWEYAVVWRQRGWFKMRLGDRYAAFGGQTVVPFDQEKPPFWRYDRYRARMLFSLYHMKPEFLDHYARELVRGRYRFWQGYPSSIGLIAQHLIDNDVELGAAAPRVVFTSSEMLLRFHQDRIQRATGAAIVDRYGNAELSVSAVECPEERYHVDTEFGIVEIDPHEETDEWVRGEIISTGFANKSMPFIRYRTGDVATLRKRGGCPCGRSRPVLEQVEGRLEDYIITPDGRRVGRMDHVFKEALEVKEAQILQPSPRRIIVRLVPRRGFGADAQRQLDRAFRTRLGNEIEIVYERTHAIPRSAHGKFRAVVSEIESERVR
jgi:phenylacetate-CoA ligase